MLRFGGSILKEIDFESRLTEVGQAVEKTLAGILGSAPLPRELGRPERLIEAMRYATLAGGKRLRPFLATEVARLFGAEGEGVLRAGAAVELIHCYSLVHDDLPAMDDDDLRRGLPTTHRAYDDATAILVGDSLLTLAFDVLADEATDPDPAIRADLVLTLARASGLGGMAGGQILDLAAEGRFVEGGRPLSLSEAEILKLQAMKTGALLTASAEMGAVVGRASRDGRKALIAYGVALGQAFQVADDILDVEADAATMGKATGKDSEQGKATLIGLWGLDGAKTRLAALVEKAEEALAGFGPEASVLRHAARFVAYRKS